MGMSQTLWGKYCAFFDQSLEVQLRYNESQRDQLFQDWKGTVAARELCKGEVPSFKDIPVTTYDDYPILEEYGSALENLTELNKRTENESMWEYFERLGKQASSVIEGWLPDKFGFATKTSGTSGTSKWYVHGRSFFDVCKNNISAFFVVACSDEWGKSRLKKGATILPIAGPTPYSGGVIYRTIVENGFAMVPPIEVIDNVQDMRKKLMHALNLIENGTKIDLAGGLSSPFHLACRYFVDRPGLYKDYFDSFGFGPKKIVLGLMWFLQSLKNRTYEKASEVMPVKGICIAGIDTKIYKPYFVDQFGVKPYTVYGSTETGFPFIGIPEKKDDLMPLINSGYFEFLDSKGDVVDLMEVSEGETYEFVFTPYRSVLIRFRMGDLFTVVGRLDNGLPLFRFESRKEDLLDILNYYRLSEAIAVQSLVAAGVPPTEKWAFVKELEPEEHICLLMEKEWEYSEREASERVFRAMQHVDIHFNNYVTDLGIKDSWKAIKVEYLPKGAFMRYVIHKTANGSELGQVKPLKLITPANQNVAELLRKV